VIVFLTDVQLATDYGFYSGLMSRIHEVNRAKDVAVIGHGNSGHAQLFHALDKFFHVAGAVQHGVVGVEMQVNELGHGLCNDFTLASF
jgi:hypothetical protein